MATKIAPFMKPTVEAVADDMTICKTDSSKKGDCGQILVLPVAAHFPGGPRRTVCGHGRGVGYKVAGSGQDFSSLPDVRLAPKSAPTHAPTSSPTHATASASAPSPTHASASSRHWRLLQRGRYCRRLHRLLRDEGTYIGTDVSAVHSPTSSPTPAPTPTPTSA